MGYPCLQPWIRTPIIPKGQDKFQWSRESRICNPSTSPTTGVPQHTYQGTTVRRQGKRRSATGLSMKKRRGGGGEDTWEECGKKERGMSWKTRYISFPAGTPGWKFLPSRPKLTSWTLGIFKIQFLTWPKLYSSSPELTWPQNHSFSRHHQISTSNLTSLADQLFKKTLVQKFQRALAPSISVAIVPDLAWVVVHIGSTTFIIVSRNFSGKKIHTGKLQNALAPSIFICLRWDFAWWAVNSWRTAVLMRWDD